MNVVLSPKRDRDKKWKSSRPTVESRVDVVVQDSNTVAIVGVGISSPLAVVVADNTVETLGGPGNVGGGHTRVGSNSESESVAVSVISVSASLSVVVSTLNNI